MPWIQILIIFVTKFWQAMKFLQRKTWQHVFFVFQPWKIVGVHLKLLNFQQWYLLGKEEVVEFDEDEVAEPTAHIEKRIGHIQEIFYSLHDNPNQAAPLSKSETFFYEEYQKYLRIKFSNQHLWCQTKPNHHQCQVSPHSIFLNPWKVKVHGLLIQKFRP